MKENSPKELGGVWTTAKYVQSQKLEKQLPTPGYSKPTALLWSEVSELSMQLGAKKHCAVPCIKFSGLCPSPGLSLESP